MVNVEAEEQLLACSESESSIVLLHPKPLKLNLSFGEVLAWKFLRNQMPLIVRSTQAPPPLKILATSMSGIRNGRGANRYPCKF